jgi:ABC-type multidrug transport system fused ATPase/permease subunit
MKQVKWLWNQMKGYRARYVFSVVVLMIPIIMQLQNPIISQMIVDQVILKIPEYKGDMQELIDRLIRLLAWMVSLMVIRTEISVRF